MFLPLYLSGLSICIYNLCITFGEYFVLSLFLCILYIPSYNYTLNSGRGEAGRQAGRGGGRHGGRVGGKGERQEGREGGRQGG